MVTGIEQPIIEPLHHRRYRHWWLRHCEVRSGALKSRIKIQKHLWLIGKLMDQCQDRFTFPEFQKFKVTLPGYVAFWDNFRVYAEGEIHAVFGPDLVSKPDKLAPVPLANSGETE